MAKRIPPSCSMENCTKYFSRCGTVAAYCSGCRCATCTKANSAATAARRKKHPPRNHGKCSPENCGDLYEKCGDRGTYTSYNCRCSACSEASNAYQRNLKANRLEINPGGECSVVACGEVFPKCGTISAFVGKKCRCIACVDANNAYQRDRMAKKMPKNHGECSQENCGKLYSRCGTITTFNCQKCRCSACLEAERKWNREWAAANPEAVRMTAHRARAKRAAALSIKYTVEQLAQKYEYWGNVCHIQGPGCTLIPEDIEHVIPLVGAGGLNVLANLRPACSFCNGSKFNKWPYPIRLIPSGEVKTFPCRKPSLS